MAETNLSKEDIRNLLTEAMAAAVNLPRAMNPMEKKQYEEEIKREKRRAILSVELGKAEAEKRYRQQTGCTHSRLSTAAGARAGQPAPRGQGEWTTGGQVHGYDTIGLVCLRCSTSWQFKATPQEIEFANQVGLLGFAPPPIERCINKADFEKPVAPDPAKLEKVAV